MAAPNPERQRAAREKLDQLFAHRASVFVIHYACQSLAQGDRHGSPRVTAVAARNLETGEVTSFSIHTEAELQRLSPMQILSRLDHLERSMLDKLFEFLKANRAMRFVHWNMRDEVFGFPALELRYGILGGTAPPLSDTGRIDLARLLADIYGTSYVAPPLMLNLARRNDLVLQGALFGKDEADAFERGAYAAVKRSTIAKVGVMFQTLQLAHDRTLRTNAGWWTLNVGRVREAAEMFERNPVQAVAGLVVAVGGTVFGVVLKWLG